MSTATISRILLVDDEPANLDVLCRMLEGRGYELFLAPDGAQGLRVAEQVHPDLILLDISMPQMDGFEVCQRLRSTPATAATPVIFVTARDLRDDVVRGFEAGGVDYITKPYHETEVVARVETHLRLSQLARQLRASNDELMQKNQELEQEIAQRKVLRGQLSVLSSREAERWGLEGFVGQSPTIQRIFDDVRLMQENATPSVLINGESGTGKELIARAIHYGSARRDGPFIPVNCAALPADLAESMLFGHEKGAFTGADEERMGYFEMANGGTLFLDEMGDMPLPLQAKLLRVLEDGDVWRVGAKQGRRVDVRALAATNIDLQQRIREGAFRQDLYYRVARFTVTSPPLRERRDDIPLLARHFLTLLANEMGREVPTLTRQALDRLQEYDYPGNVRELKNIVERALLESGDEPIRPSVLRFPSVPATQVAVSNGEAPQELPMDLDRAAERAKLWVVKSALGRTQGNITEAANLLDTNRNRIYRILGQE